MAAQVAEVLSAPRRCHFERLEDYLLLFILDSCDLLSLIRLTRVCKRLYLCAHDVMARSPGMCEGPWDGTRGGLVLLASRLQSPPNVLICMTAGGCDTAASMESLRETISSELPSTMSVLISDNSHVQHGGACVSKTKAKTKLKAVCLLGSFPEATAASFVISNETFAHSLEGLEEGDAVTAINSMLASAGGLLLSGDAAGAEAEEWKVVIVTARPDEDGGWCEIFLRLLQRRFPEAAIIGGVATSGHHATLNSGVFTSSTTKANRDSIALLCLGGNCPVRSVVTRGVEPMGCAWAVREAEWLDDYNESVDPWDGHKLCLLAKLQPAAAAAAAAANIAHAEGTEPLQDAKDVLRSVAPGGAQQAIMMGHRFAAPPAAPAAPAVAAKSEGNRQEDEEDGSFVLSGVGSSSVHDGKIVLVLPDGGTRLPSHVQFFKMSKEACTADLQHQLRSVHAQAARQRQKVMGGIMFTCSARGPQKGGLASAAMMDATVFQAVFGPATPLVGTYCNGEIGPVARAAGSGEPGGAAMACTSPRTLYRSGGVALQGFTAVFGIFCLPTTKRESNLRELLGQGVGAAGGGSGGGVVGSRETSEELVRRVCSQLLASKRR